MRRRRNESRQTWGDDESMSDIEREGDGEVDASSEQI
jgi:hypothetical protein